MAKGRKPQLSLEDLLEFIKNTQRIMTGGERLGPQSEQLDAAEYLLREGAAIASPFTSEEIGRFTTKGPDRGHAASLALYAALSRANKIPDVIRGAVRGYRGTKEMLKEAPRGSRTQPRRTASANMGGVANDPMALYAALVASQNRR